MQGWVKVHRKLLTSEVFRNEKILKVFIYCLLKATHADYEQNIGRQTVDLIPGQFIFGRKKAALELDMKESTVRDYMSLLKKDSIIDIKTTNKYSVVTVVNWEFYQSDEEKTDNKNDSKRTTKRQQINTNKNIKNIKNKNTSCPKSKIYDEESVPYQLSIRLLNNIRQNNEGFKEPNLQSWSNDFRLMMEKDNRTEEQIKYLIDWSQQDTFWKANILSPAKLRKQYDQLVAKIKADKEKVKSSKLPSPGNSQATTLKPFDF